MEKSTGTGGKVVSLSASSSAQAVNVEKPAGEITDLNKGYVPPELRKALEALKECGELGRMLGILAVVKAMDDGTIRRAGRNAKP